MSCSSTYCRECGKELNVFLGQYEFCDEKCRRQFESTVIEFGLSLEQATAVPFDRRGERIKRLAK